MKTVKNEWVHWLILAIPFIYLAVAYPALPNVVPTHFDVNGTPNDYSNKTMFLWLVPLLTLGIYFLMMVIPRIDPKKRLTLTPKLMNSLRLLFTVFFSALGVIIVYVAKPGANLKLGTHLIMAAVGLLFMLLGNYLTAVQPNYFIGIRTPWTLEDPIVWQKTHRIFGRIWFFIGLFATILFLVFPQYEFINTLFIGAIIASLVGAVLYSYLLFRKLHANQEN